MSNFVIGNTYLILSLFISALGQILIKKIYIGVPSDASVTEVLKCIIFTDRIWSGIAAGILIVTGFVLWLLCLYKLPLSYAYPIACTSVLLVTFLCIVFLGETVTWRLWVGTFLIAFGSALVVTQK